MHILRNRHLTLNYKPNRPNSSVLLRFYNLSKRFRYNTTLCFHLKCPGNCLPDYTAGYLGGVTGQARSMNFKLPTKENYSLRYPAFHLFKQCLKEFFSPSKRKKLPSFYL